MQPIRVNDFAEWHLVELNENIANKLKGDCVFIRANVVSPLDNAFRAVIEILKEYGKQSGEQKHLVVLLETAGGYIETVERIVSVMRKHYSEVSFIVPSHAYSAGTVLVLSGDHIYMDYYSVLGPIDPQYDDSEGKSMLPGAGYLAKFEEMTEKVNALGISNATAEISYLIKRFDPAKLFQIEQDIEHGISLITEWLPKYKFKHWKKTDKRGKEVTPTMRSRRAKQIAKKLGDAKRWHSHGRGITMLQLCSDEIKLQINDFGKDAELNSAIRDYYSMCTDFANKTGMNQFIHSKRGYYL